MRAKRWWQAALLLITSMSAGCCAFCDRWCGTGRSTAAAPVCCFTPVCVPAQTTTAGAAPAPGWNAPAGQAALPCVPCAPAPVR